MAAIILAASMMAFAKSAYAIVLCNPVIPMQPGTPIPPSAKARLRRCDGLRPFPPAQIRIALPHKAEIGLIRDEACEYRCREDRVVEIKQVFCLAHLPAATAMRLLVGTHAGIVYYFELK
jgi:hypothetical protein